MIEFRPCGCVLTYDSNLEARWSTLCVPHMVELEAEIREAAIDELAEELDD